MAALGMRTVDSILVILGLKYLDKDKQKFKDKMLIYHCSVPLQIS